jgi:hypothetical protein
VGITNRSCMTILRMILHPQTLRIGSGLKFFLSTSSSWCSSRNPQFHEIEWVLGLLILGIASSSGKFTSLMFGFNPLGESGDWWFRVKSSLSRVHSLNQFSSGHGLIFLGRSFGKRFLVLLRSYGLILWFYKVIWSSFGFFFLLSRADFWRLLVLPTLCR